MSGRTSDDICTNADMEAFSDEGLLQEANRLFFHPVGFALAMVCDEENPDEPAQLRLYKTDDPEGFTFGDMLDPRKTESANVFFGNKAIARNRRLGYVTEPFPEQEQK